MSFASRTNYKLDKPILAYDKGNVWGRSILMTNEKVALNSEGSRLIPEGVFLSRVGEDVRILPRAKVTQATTTGTATLKMSPYFQFVAGDVLNILEPYAIITAATVGVGQTLIVTVGGFAATYTSETTVLADFFAEAATFFNDAPILGTTANFVASATQLFVFAADGVTLHSIEVAGTVGTPAITGAATALAFNNTAVGTILATDEASEVVTLTGNASVALPVGVSIGVRTNEVYGLSVKSQDMTVKNRYNFACLTESSGVRVKFLPYFDGSLAQAFPKILFAENI